MDVYHPTRKLADPQHALCVRTGQDATTRAKSDVQEHFVALPTEHNVRSISLNPLLFGK